MLEEAGLEPLGLPLIRSFIGDGAPALVRRVLQHRLDQVTPERHALFLERFLSHYNDRPTDLTRLFAGAADALAQLHAAGHRLALCTNKPANLSRLILNDLGISHYFESLVAGDSLSVRKPHPAPLLAALAPIRSAAAFYIGDSEIDAQTAQAAEVPFLFFT